MKRRVNGFGGPKEIAMAKLQTTARHHIAAFPTMCGWTRCRLEWRLWGRARHAAMPKVSLYGLMFAVLGLLSVAMRADAGISGDTAVFESLVGEVVLENDRVRVQKFRLEPGRSTGRYVSGMNRLFVFIKGGVLTRRASGRSVLWRDGRVAWHGADERSEEGSTNTGRAPVEWVCVTLKPAAEHPQSGSADSSELRHLSYPNVPGEDLLENDFVIVQRFTLMPGQWEGPHGHQPNTLWIFVRGGKGAARSKQEPEHPYPRPFADGEVGWMTPIDPSAGHESGNVDDHPSDFIWVILRR